MKLPTIAQDKANHFIYGACLAALASLYAWQVALVAGLIVGIGKEVLDRHDNLKRIKEELIPSHDADWKDTAWTFGGTLVVVIPQIFVKYFI